MIIGCPQEVKEQEYRVGITPNNAAEMVKHGHTVLIQKDAGVGAGFSNHEYIEVGAQIVTCEETWRRSDMIVKVKEPKLFEIEKMREGQIIFTYLHLAADRAQTEALMKQNVVAIAYETITDDRGTLPLLAPMSEVAGRLAPQVGSWALQKANGGLGKLMGGVPGVEPCKVLVIGGGMVGTNAAVIASGMGADVTVVDRSIDRMRYLDDVYGGKFKTAFADAKTTDRLAMEADMVIGAVLIPGAAAPKLISKDQVKRMKKGAVLVDVAIDQGGCFETSHATTHNDPIYDVDGVIHYCVANMPGAVAQTSAVALNNATLPYVLQVADYGYEEAMERNEHLKRGLNVCMGEIRCDAVSEALRL